MLRKLTAAALTYRAILLIVHGLGWMFFGNRFGGDLSSFSMVSMGVSMLSMSGALVLLTFAYLATRRGKADWSAQNAALDSVAENTGAHQETSLNADPDAVIERYLAEKSQQKSAEPIAPVKPIMAVSSRPVFGRKTA